MIKKLVDKDKAFEMYYALGTSRSLPILREVMSRDCADNVPSARTLKDWSKKYGWQERVMLHDQEVQKGVQEKMMPEWIETKAYLLKVALEQVKKGRDAGVVPTSTRDMMAAIKEARSIMGETDKVEVTGTLKHDVNADPDVLKAANELARKLSRK